jgi:hypothetical protein
VLLHCQLNCRECESWQLIAALFQAATRNSHCAGATGCLTTLTEALFASLPSLPLQAKACFVIEYDQDAFLAASTSPAAASDFFYTTMVLSEGAPVPCEHADTQVSTGM